MLLQSWANSHSVPFGICLFEKLRLTELSGNWLRLSSTVTSIMSSFGVFATFRLAVVSLRNSTSNCREIVPSEVVTKLNVDGASHAKALAAATSPPEIGYYDTQGCEFHYQARQLFDSLLQDFDGAV